MNYKYLKNKALNRKRRIIYDNDGGDIRECESATEDSFLSQRMYPLLGTKVDSVFYTPMSSGFGQFTHRTEIGTVCAASNDFYRSISIEEFYKNGIDIFEMITGFCNKNNIEIFWQMRMNDTHDGSDNWYGSVIFENNKLKNDHPEYLLGNKENRPKYGAWSAVNYMITEIRELAFKYVEEAADKYNIDGISLDFFRHPVFFRSTSMGLHADKFEVAAMTELIKHISEMLVLKGKEKGKAILLAVRVPDSVEYCLDLGIDIVKWLSEGYVDILITSSYLQLNNWEYSVELGHKYGVKVYPSLDECRIKDKRANDFRRSLECYRARAMNVWNAGADGIFLFNYFIDYKKGPDEDRLLLCELAEQETLKKLERVYVASYRGIGSIAGGGLPHEKHINIPVLNPDSPAELEYMSPYTVQILIGEDTADNRVDVQFSLQVRVNIIDESQLLAVKLNGTELEYIETKDVWMIYEADRKTIRKGLNEFTAMQIKQTKHKLLLEDLAVRIGEGELS